MWDIWTREYYFAIIKNKILSFVPTRVGLEGIMLREICHTEKDRYPMTSLTWGI